MTDQWPSYRIGPSDHLYAIGVIAMNWNSLELVTQALFSTVMRSPDGVAAAVFLQLGNVARSQTLLDVAKKWNSLDPAVIDAISYQTKAYDICRQNRNTILHSFPTESGSETHMSLNKFRSALPMKLIERRLPVSDIRRVADDMFRLMEFTGRLGIHIQLVYSPRAEMHPDLVSQFPLPNIPALPRSMG